MIFETNLPHLKNELQSIVNLFENQSKRFLNLTIKHESHTEQGVVFNRVWFGSKSVCMQCEPLVQKSDELALQKQVKNSAKRCLFLALKKRFHKKIPWGILTGIRPDEVYRDLVQDFGLSNARERLKKDYFVQPQKIDLLARVVETQGKLESDPKKIALYVHIPFCTTTCTYCSFITTPLSNPACVKWVAPYVENLLKEIETAKQMIADKNWTVSSIYVGGGTPTALTANQLKTVLEALKDIPAGEFTVEAGRPDTITKEKLEVMASCGVSRMSINPQSFHDKTLQAIGRSHKVQDILTAYDQSLYFPFVKNMDLIAGLNGEKLTQFQQSLFQTLALNPENITVHTLSLKRASALNQEGGVVSDEKQVQKMVNWANKILHKNGYEPYYLYKQKYMIGNLENVGYCKPHTACAFNIFSMEDQGDIVALGAGAISKKIDLNTHLIERYATTKNVVEYNQNIESIRNKLKSFFLG